MKKLFVVHGDKGGVGKSTFAFLHADFLLARHRQIVIVEGDKKISGSRLRMPSQPQRSSSPAPPPSSA